MTTMADVAARAGVSVSTVSHVINGTRYVSEETSDAVQQAIRELGYIHNTIARSLAMGGTQTIGVAIAAVTNSYFAQLVAAIHAAAGAAGYTLLIADTRDDPDEELRVVQGLHQRRVDGILLAPVAGADGPALTYLRELGVPTVLLDRCADDSMDQIGSENKNAMAFLTKHLTDLGHRRVGLVAALPSVATSKERLAGYRLALRRAGIAYDANLVVQGHSMDALGQSAAHTVEVAVTALLQSPNPPTALVVANDWMTIRTMRAAVNLGMQVPDDLALAVFDDFDWSDVFYPRLTAMAQPVAEIGSGAMSMLLARLRDPDAPPTTSRLNPRFVHRESCGCATAVGRQRSRATSKSG